MKKNKKIGDKMEVSTAAAAAVGNCNQTIPWTNKIWMYWNWITQRTKISSSSLPHFFLRFSFILWIRFVNTESDGIKFKAVNIGLFVIIHWIRCWCFHDDFIIFNVFFFVVCVKRCPQTSNLYFNPIRY